MNYDAVCKTAQATPGLSKILPSLNCDFSCLVARGAAKQVIMRQTHHLNAAVSQAVIRQAVISQAAKERQSSSYRFDSIKRVSDAVITHQLGSRKRGCQAAY